MQTVLFEKENFICIVTSTFEELSVEIGNVEDV